jgi:hypothetical protein
MWNMTRRSHGAQLDPHDSVGSVEVQQLPPIVSVPRGVSTGVLPAGRRLRAVTSSQQTLCLP